MTRNSSLLGLFAMCALAGCPYDYPGDVGQDATDAPDAPVDGEIDSPEIDAGPDAPDIDAPGVVQWARTMGGGISELAVASDGSVVVVGNFDGTVDLGGAQITSNGLSDLFVAKYSAAGTHVWSRKIGGVQSDVSGSVALDSAGDVYVSGRFGASVDIDGQVLTAQSSRDGLLAKLGGATGTRVWAIRYGGASGTIESVKSTTSGAGATVVAVSFNGTVSFGGGNQTAQAGGTDIAVARYDGTGAHIWSIARGGPSSDVPQAVAFVGADVLVGGYFSNTANFGGTALTAQGAGDAFLARYNGGSGAHVWSFRHGGSDGIYRDEIRHITGDATSFYIGGHFASLASFGGGMLSAVGREDGVFARYDTATGSHAWSRSIGGSTTDTAERVAVLGNEIWVLGDYAGTASISGGGSVTSAGLDDVFLIRATADTGSPISATTFGGPGVEAARGFWLTPTTIAVAGTLSMSFTFFGEELVPGPANTDSFVGQASR